MMSVRVKLYLFAEHKYEVYADNDNRITDILYYQRVSLAKLDPTNHKDKPLSIWAENVDKSERNIVDYGLIASDNRAIERFLDGMAARK